MKDIYDTYGLTATCGIGTNMYLAKVALDIMSKHSPTNIGWLNKEKYEKELWHYKPLTDFWQIGKGIAKRLEKLGFYDMYDIAHCDEKRLYKEFGVNAEFLIDHSKGEESCTIKDIKSYVPKTNSISNSQVLFKDYNYVDSRLVLKEMVELLSQKLVEKNLETDCIKLYIGYSKDVIKSTGGSRRLSYFTNSYKKLSEEFIRLFEQTTNINIPIRRIGISFDRLQEQMYGQINIFEDEENKQRENILEKSII